MNDVKGGSAVVFAISLPVVIGAIAMTVEVGHWRQSKARLQNAADMAAIAGARQLIVGLNSNKTVEEYQFNIYMAAFGDAYENGFDRSAGTIVVNSPPKSGEYTGQDGVEIIVRQKKERAFSGAIFKDDVYVSARAVALAMEGITEACVLSLSETAGPALSVSGSAALTLNGCSIRSNSSAANSIEAGGSSNITADCGYTVGGASTGSNFTPTDPECTGIKTRVSPLTDPYGHVEAPSAAELAAMGCKDQKDLVNVHKWERHMPAGRYCGDVRWKDLLTLEDGGTYYFDGADLTLSSGFAEMTGRNVTLVFLNGGTFSNANSGHLDLTAPTTGDYAGIVFYGDRHTSDPTQTVRVAGNATSSIEGAVYFPVNALEYRGGSTGSSGCTQVIGNTVDFGGNASLTNTDCGKFGAESLGGSSSGVTLFE